MNKFRAYAVLFAHAGMTQEELKAAHRSLSQKYHPDRQGGDTSKFLEVQGGWRLVRDTEARRLLATQLKGLGHACNFCHARGYIFKGKSFGPKIKFRCPQCEGCGYLPRSSSHA